MKFHFSFFLTFILSVLCLGSYYLGTRLIARVPIAKAHSTIIWLALFLFVVVQILGPVLYRTYPNRESASFIFHWAVYSSLGLFACLFFYTLVADITLTAWKWMFHPQNGFDVERRSFMGVSMFAFASTMIGAFQAYRGPKVYSVEIPIADLPLELAGFKIVQITDLHAGPTIGKSYIKNVVEIANSLNPDLVALTGDMVDGRVEALSPDLEPLKALKSTHGSFFITGNHEYYWGALQWIQWFKDAGSQVLLNEHRVLTHKGQPLVIAGVTDHSAGRFFDQHRSDPLLAAQGAPAGVPKILLAHQPASFEKADQAGFQLQLSGHTHGGQFFPWSIFVSLFHRYYRGLNLHNKMWVYVSRGTAYWGPPMRFGVPSEITELTLRRA